MPTRGNYCSWRPPPRRVRWAPHAPYLLSERAPRWSSLARGAYIGLTRAHRREHLVRAAIEGVCMQLALVLLSMQSAGLEILEIRVTGGVMRSPLWRQTWCDALGMELHFAEVPRDPGSVPPSWAWKP